MEYQKKRNLVMNATDLTLEGVPYKVDGRANMPLPGDRVRFIAKAGIHEHEVSGVYQFRRNQSYVILDDGGGEVGSPEHVADEEGIGPPSRTSHLSFQHRKA